MEIDMKAMRRVAQGLQQWRLAVGSKSLLAFGELYLKRHFKLRPSKMHLELAESLEAMVRERGARAAWAAPRGHAKSTLVTLAYVLWCICYRHEPYIVIWSSSDERAKQLLAHVREELETNPRLRADFPEICPVRSGHRLKPYRSNVITVGPKAPIRVAAFGVQKATRGIRSGEHRPSLIILDDIETEDGTDSPERRDKLKGWFTKVVLNLGDKRTNIILLGTIIHFDSLLAKYTGKEVPGWDGRIFLAVIQWADRGDLWKKWQAIYQNNDTWRRKRGKKGAAAYFEVHRKAMLKGTEVLWPQREDYHDLMQLKCADGDAFSSEKQNQPVAADLQLFKSEDFVYWTKAHTSAEALIESASRGSLIFGACDPALGKTGRRGDYTAIATILVDIKAERVYVIEVDMRRLAPLETVELIIEKQKCWKYHAFGIEVNQFQQLMASDLRHKSAKAGVDVRVMEIQNTMAKTDRIQKLRPFVLEGSLLFNKHDRNFLNQLTQFPMAAHDDGPDAVVMAMQAGIMYRAMTESREPILVRREELTPWERGRRWLRQ